jgi:hypothetical protein
MPSVLELQRENLEKSAEIGRLKREAQKVEFQKELQEATKGCAIYGITLQSMPEKVMQQMT